MGDYDQSAVSIGQDAAMIPDLELVEQSLLRHI